MAYESGYNAVDYIGDCIKKYTNDQMIFVKASQLLQTYMARPDWPHSFDEFDKASTLLLGDYLTSVADFGVKYAGDDRIVWPDALPENFINELKSFCVSINPIIERCYSFRTSPLRFSGIAQSWDRDKQIIRFLRMDGQYLDLELSENDLRQIILALKEIANAREER